MTPRRGRLIAFEGIDGSGKSTQARRLADGLGALLTFEPGATVLGRSLRRLVLGPEAEALTPRAEALVMAADRAQHVDEIILPALEGGRWVVTDRFSGSTLAYQGWGRGLPVDSLRAVVTWSADGLDPDLSILIDVPTKVARQRIGKVAPDRLERLEPAFHERVRDGFLELARADRQTWVVVDGVGDEAEVADRVATAVRGRLGWSQ